MNNQESHKIEIRSEEIAKQLQQQKRKEPPHLQSKSEELPAATGEQKKTPNQKTSSQDPDRHFENEAAHCVSVLVNGFKTAALTLRAFSGIPDYSSQGWTPFPPQKT